MGQAVQDNRKILYTAGVEATLEYSAAERVTKRAPKIQLFISAFNMPFCPIEIVSTDVASIILNCVFEKSRSLPGGAVSLTLAGDRDALDNIHLPVAGQSALRSRWDQFGPDLRDIFKPMSLAQLWINGYAVCTGFVRSCVRDLSAGGNIIYIVSIDELGQFYNESILSYDVVATGMSEESATSIQDMTRILKMSGQKAAVDMDEALREFVQAFLFSHMWIPNSTPPYTMLSDGTPLMGRFVAMKSPLGGISINSILKYLSVETAMIENAAGGSFWDFIKGMIPDPFMELFTETGGRTIVTGRGIACPMLAGMNYLIARTAPYEVPWIGASPWLPNMYPYLLSALDLITGGDYIIVTDDDIMNKRLGQSDAQQYTHFNCELGGKGGAFSSTVRQPPSIAAGPAIPVYGGGVRTYGRREFQTGIPSVDTLNFGQGLDTLISDPKIGQAMEGLSKRVNSTINIPILATMLNVWFRNAAKFNEGTIKTRCMAYARPGMYLLYLPSLSGSRVECPRDLGLYYIDNVTHSYELGHADTSTFSVIRGVPIPNDLQNSTRLLFDWEIMVPGTGMFDGNL